jgi:hypothetical protein
MPSTAIPKVPNFGELDATPPSVRNLARCYCIDQDARQRHGEKRYIRHDPPETALEQAIGWEALPRWYTKIKFLYTL